MIRKNINSQQSPLFSYIESTSRRYPDKICLHMEENSTQIEYTFRGLIKTSLALADTLGQKNLRQGDRVAILSEGRPEAVAAYLGLLINRCTPVLLDPGLMPADLMHLIAKSDVRAAFLSEQNIKKLPCSEFLQRPAFNLNDGFKVIDGFSQAVDPGFPETQDPDTSLGAILFSSGTTAGYKAIMHSESSMLEHLIQIQKTFQVNQKDSIVTVLPIHHIYPFISSILVPLIAGMTNTFVEKIDAASITETLQQSKPTVVCLVPRILYLFHSGINAKINDLFFLKRWAILGLASLGHQIHRATRININRYLFSGVQKKFGGKLEKISCGGAALDLARIGQEKKNTKKVKEQIEKSILNGFPDIPMYMRIQKVCFLEDFPMTGLSKIRRGEIRKRCEKLDPQLFLPDQKRPFSPATETERVVYKCWKEILNIEVHQGEDHFSALGGDSLELADIVATLSEHFHLPEYEPEHFHSFLSDPTIKNMAELFDQLRAKARNLSDKPDPVQESDREDRIGTGPPYFRSTYFSQILGSFYQIGFILFLPLLIAGSLFPVLQLFQHISIRLGHGLNLFLMPFYAMGSFLLLLSLAILLKWIIIGRFRPGVYPIFGLYYYRWWSVSRLFDFLHINCWPFFILLKKTKTSTTLKGLVFRGQDG